MVLSKANHARVDIIRVINDEIVILNAFSEVLAIALNNKNTIEKIMIL